MPTSDRELTEVVNKLSQCAHVEHTGGPSYSGVPSVNLTFDRTKAREILDRLLGGYQAKIDQLQGQLDDIWGDTDGDRDEEG
jgi:hypothetical protein